MDAAKKKLEKRGIKMKETRSYYVPEDLKIRAADGDDSDGIFEGYAVVWDSVDSHGTRFKKGSFKKTLQERGDKIKILYNHDTDEPIGKPLEMKEDNTGLFVRGQLTAGVKRADETALNIQAEVIDTLSIGFNTILDSPAGAFRDITEVKLYEFSPVTFASNEKAKITGFRSEEFAQPDNDPITDTSTDSTEEGGDDTRNDDPPENADPGSDDPQLTRDTDFNESLKGEELYQRKWLLMDALHITLSDIWWSDLENDEIVSALDTALATFHNQYLAWVNEFIANFWEQRFEIMADKELTSIFNLEMRKAGKTIESLAAETSFTADELRTLSRGNLLPLESRNKLAELPDAIGAAHQEKRKMAVEELCNELRSAQFTKAEASRFGSLLGLNNSEETEVSDTRDFSSIQDSLKKLRESVDQ